MRALRGVATVVTVGCMRPPIAPLPDSSPPTAGSDTPPAPPAPVVRSWRPPVEVGRAGWNAASSLRVAVSASGDAVVLFQDAGAVWALHYDSASDSFTPPWRLSTDGATIASSALIAMDERGGAIAAWATPGGDAGAELVARVFTAAGGWPAGWGSAETVVDGPSVYLTALSMTPSGHAAAAWMNGSDTAFIAIRDRERGWTAPAQFVSGDRQVITAAAAMAEIGRTLKLVVAGTTFPAARVAGGIYRYDLDAHTGAFETAAVLVPSDPIEQAPAGVGIDRAGNAVVGVFDFVGGDERFAEPYAGAVYVVRHMNDWSSPEIAYSGPGRNPTVAVSGNGDVWVMLHDYVVTPPAYEARRATRAGWQPPSAVPLGLSLIAIDGQGGAFATSTSYDPTDGGIRVSRFDQTDGWSQPKTLSLGESTSTLDSSPAIAVAANGAAVVVWTRTVSKPGSLIGDTVEGISAAVYR